uniref:Uncharacterized protein n=1 Tax=Quercus lobata TaxID=97700 RepID=A0A7N2R0S2_QUELO
MFKEKEVFHGMEECKAGEATSSRFWKPYLEYKSDLFPTLKVCKVGEATSSRYEDITNTLDQVTITEQHSCLICFLQDVGNRIKSTSLLYLGLWLKTKMKILHKQKFFLRTLMQVLLNGSRHSSRAAFVVYERDLRNENQIGVAAFPRDGAC